MNSRKKRILINTHIEIRKSRGGKNEIDSLKWWWKKRPFRYCEQLNNGRKNEKKGRLVDWFFIQYVPLIRLVASNTHVLTLMYVQFILFIQHTQLISLKLSLSPSPALFLSLSLRIAYSLVLIVARACFARNIEVKSVTKVMQKVKERKKPTVLQKYSISIGKLPGLHCDCGTKNVIQSKRSERKREREQMIENKTQRGPWSTTTTIMYYGVLISNRWGGNYFKLLNWREFCLFILMLCVVPFTYSKLCFAHSNAERQLNEWLSWKMKKNK